MDILTKIIDKKRERIAAAKAICSLEVLQAQCTSRPPRPAGRFQAAIGRIGAINIIAEIKKASPSKGIIRADFDPVAIARQYQAAGAAAISVLTEEDFFQGSLDILRQVRATVELPLLRKDFIVDEYQIYEAAAAGADAFLLIAALLEEAELVEMMACGRRLGLDALIEVHTAQELEKVLNSQATIVGVNNRNLKTFEVTLNTSIQLAAHAPANLLLVSESGINTADDIRRLQQAGYQAFLVGEQLMRADNPGEALTTLLVE